MERPRGRNPSRGVRNAAEKWEVAVALFDDDRPKKPPRAAPGEDLTLLSLEELAERIAIYRAEIERLELDIDRKQKSRQAADSFFRK